MTTRMSAGSAQLSSRRPLLCPNAEAPRARRRATGGLGGVGRQARHAGTLEHSLRVIDATTALALVVGISLEKQLGRHVVKALGGVYGYVMQSGLPAELIDPVYLRVSQINNCAYWHTRDLIKKGVKKEQLTLVQAWAEAGHLFSERERAALAWTETVTRVSETGVPDAAF
jgi:AhpD family alkylhydroperoxidase